MLPQQFCFHLISQDIVFPATFWLLNVIFNKLWRRGRAVGIYFSRLTFNNVRLASGCTHITLHDLRNLYLACPSVFWPLLAFSLTVETFDKTWCGNFWQPPADQLISFLILILSELFILLYNYVRRSHKHVLSRSNLIAVLRWPLCCGTKHIP